MERISVMKTSPSNSSQSEETGSSKDDKIEDDSFEDELLTYFMESYGNVQNIEKDYPKVSDSVKLSGTGTALHVSSTYSSISSMLVPCISL